MLDEFAPFGYRNFAQILQTARGTNTAFLFSMQSLPQLMQVGRGFKEEVTSAPNTTITLRTRDEETAKYFIKASAEQVVTRRSIQKERGFFGWGNYEETGRATESEDRETRSQDESIKNLPKGQMEILMSDDTRGTLHSLPADSAAGRSGDPGISTGALSANVALACGVEWRQFPVQGYRSWRASTKFQIDTQETSGNENAHCDHACLLDRCRERPACAQFSTSCRAGTAKGGAAARASRHSAA